MLYSPLHTQCNILLEVFLLLVPGLDSEDVSIVGVGRSISSEGEGSSSHRVVSIVSMQCWRTGVALAIVLR